MTIIPEESNEKGLGRHGVERIGVVSVINN
jgi:hypothetical protein